VDLAELDSLRVWLERRYPTQLREYSRRPPGYSCREHKGPCLEVSWCEGLTHLRLCWRYPGEPWRCAELPWGEVRRLLGEYRTWFKGVAMGWRGL